MHARGPISWLVAFMATVGALLALTRCPGSSTTPSKPSPPPPPRAELVLLSGTVVTFDPQVPAATALAIKDGRIVAVGSDAELKPWIGSDTRVIDLKGRTAVPGLADAHLHLSSLGARAFSINLVGTRSLDEVRARVKAAAAAAKKGDWLLGRGWDQNDWAQAAATKRPGKAEKKRGADAARGGGGFPTARDLDDISGDHPVVLARIDGHAVWANTKAMEAAGVNGKTKPRPGGEIVKLKGKPSGIFIDNAMGLIAEKAPSPSREQAKAAILAAQKECLAAGLTQVHDMGVDRQAVEILRELDKSGELRLRVYAFLAGSVEDLGGLLAGGPTMADGDKGRLTLRGVKFFVDGALGSRGALLLKPYSDDKKSAGLFVTAPELLEARIRTAAKAGYQVATHAIGDRGNRVVLDIYERVFAEAAPDSDATGAKKGPPGGARPRIEHAQVLAVSDIPRLAKDGVVASMQPTHATSDMRWAEQRLGKDRLQGAYAWKSLLSRGATIAAGSDAPVEDVSPILALYAAVSRKDLLGNPPTGWMPEERMTPLEALRALTIGPAWASFREAEAGRIQKGFVADITVLDKNPLLATEEELSRMRSTLTIIAGRVEHANPGADAPPEPAKAPAPSKPPEPAKPPEAAKPADAGKPLQAPKPPAEPAKPLKSKTSSTSTPAR